MNTLYNDDCFNVLPKIPDKSIDLILCDPPYSETRAKWDKLLPMDKLWEQYNRIINDNGSILLFGNEPFSSKVRCSNLSMYRSTS